MKSKKEVEMSLIPEQRSGTAIDVESVVELHNEKIATVFFEIVKNRLQHVNNWSIIAGTLSADFQLVNKEGIEVYRKAQEGDFLKIDIPGPGSKTGKGYDWVRIEAMESFSNDDDTESFGFRVRPTENPFSNRGDIAHFYSEYSTSTFIVNRNGNKVSAAVFDRNTKRNEHAHLIEDKVRDNIVAGAAIMTFSHIQWQNLADGLLSR